MSKIGSKPISINKETQVTFDNNYLVVVGQGGTLKIEIPTDLQVDISNEEIKITRLVDTIRAKSLHGLTRSLINNAVLGTSKPHAKKLEVVGTGYRVKMKGEDLEFEVGFSHPVVFQKKEGISFSLESANKIVVSGIDKQLVGQTAHQILVIKKPDPYKGKGIRYSGQIIKLKPGKKAKTAEGAK